MVLSSATSMLTFDEAVKVYILLTPCSQSKTIDHTPIGSKEQSTLRKCRRRWFIVAETHPRVSFTSLQPKSPRSWPISRMWTKLPGLLGIEQAIRKIDSKKKIDRFVAALRRRTLSAKNGSGARSIYAVANEFNGVEKGPPLEAGIVSIIFS